MLFPQHHLLILSLTGKTSRWCPETKPRLRVLGTPQRPLRSRPRTGGGKGGGGGEGRGEGAKRSPSSRAVILLRNSLSSEAGEHPAARPTHLPVAERAILDLGEPPPPHPTASTGRGVPAHSDHTGWENTWRPGAAPAARGCHTWSAPA